MQLSLSGHAERNITLQRSPFGRSHRNRAGLRARRNGAVDFGIRQNGECGCRPVKADSRCALQIRPQNRDGHSDVAGGWLRLDERRQAGRDGKDNAVVVTAAEIGCSVECAVRVLHQATVGVLAVPAVEGMQVG